MVLNDNGPYALPKGSHKLRFETYPHGNLRRWLRRLSVDVVPLRHAHVRTSRTSAQTKKAQIFQGLDLLHRLRTVTVAKTLLHSIVGLSPMGAATTAGMGRVVGPVVSMSLASSETFSSAGSGVMI